jgi:hypothetical protein
MIIRVDKCSTFGIKKQLTIKSIQYSVSIICRLQTVDCRPDWVQNADWGYKMQTEDKMQTGGELGIFYKYPPSHSHVIVLVDNINVEASHFHQNGRRRQRCRGIDII